MNRQDAKRILEMLPPGGADAAHPEFAQALKVATADPELSAWLEDQQRFDRAFAQSLKNVSVPQELRHSLLARSKVVRPLAWLWQDWRIPATAAAALIIGLGLAVRQLNKPIAFSEFRQELVREAWAGETHLDFRSGDLAQIRGWLAGQGVAADLTVPEPLGAMRVQGCHIVQAGGQRVPMLCLVEGSKHLHLFVVQGAQFAGLPAQGLPDLERCGSWKTAAWQQGDKTFVLSGLKALAFVSKFRKAGRWTLWG